MQLAQKSNLAGLRSVSANTAHYYWESLIKRLFAYKEFFPRRLWDRTECG